MKQAFKYFFFGPRVYKFYANEDYESHIYVPNVAEKYASAFLRWMGISYNLSMWFSPLISVIFYKRDMFSFDGMVCMGRYISYLSLLWLSALIARGFGRFLNEDYRIALNILREVNKSSQNSMSKLRKMDISLDYWPIEYFCTTPAPLKYEDEKPKYSIAHKVLAYICVEIFGRRLLYPGSLSFIQYMMQNALIDGREKLVTKKNGRRYKIQTYSGNYIDTMFVDRRLIKENDNGSKLVICCEGNAGFYEIGCMETPLGTGYSVLGWNHPGFGGSSGKPTLFEEQEAIDAVIQFALNKLNFPIENILFFAWSIGGYSACYGAMCYPDIRCVILDATFDNIERLASERMPPSWEGMVKAATSLYLNLNNDELLIKYPGPLLFIRRCKDEIICLKQGDISTNRGNFLLEKLLKYRYPNLFIDETVQAFKYWLTLNKEQQANFFYTLTIDEIECIDMIKIHSIAYPSDLGKDSSNELKIHLLLYLADKYLDQYDATHCQPLPSSMFHEPWSPKLLSH